MSRLPPLSSVKVTSGKTLPPLTNGKTLPPLTNGKTLPPLTSPIGVNSTMTKKSKPKKERKIYIVLYVHFDDPGETRAKVFSNKFAAINYLEKEIRNIEGEEEFNIMDDSDDISLDILGMHWEIIEDEIND